MELGGGWKGLWVKRRLIMMVDIQACLDAEMTQWRRKKGAFRGQSEEHLEHLGRSRPWWIGVQAYVCASLDLMRRKTGADLTSYVDPDVQMCGLRGPCHKA